MTQLMPKDRLHEAPGSPTQTFLELELAFGAGAAAQVLPTGTCRDFLL